MRFERAMLCTGLALAAGMATAEEPEFNWLAGRWCGGSADRAIDEVWLPEVGGTLLGMSRTVREGQIESFEFMRIVPAGEDAGLHVQPNGMAATVFAVTERGVQRARFGNAMHDFPNTIEYWREGDTLHAWIAGPGEDGKEIKIPFEYRRCAN